jgi:hypothetical protein
MRHQRGTARTTSAQQAPRTRKTTRSKDEQSQLAVIGGCVFGFGIVAAIAVALASTNETHPLIKWLPWLFIIIGLGLLFWSLGRVTRTQRRSPPGPALEAPPSRIIEQQAME